MKASVTWTGGMSFEGKADSGHAVVMDSSPDFGGENKGSRPMELLLIGMGGCTSIDVMSILNKARQDVTDCIAELSAERTESIPKVFTRIHVHFKVTGRGLDPKRVEHAIELSAQKYCSASIMLGKTAEITHDFEIIESVA
ncbi:MAG: OsmC family protein [Rhodospirillales bacterium]|nr:OsmC family protein [Rhodospirillales bacterium]